MSFVGFGDSFFVTSRAISLLFRHVLCKVYRGGSYFFFGSPCDNVRAFLSFLRHFYCLGVVFIVLASFLSSFCAFHLLILPFYSVLEPIARGVVANSVNLFDLPKIDILAAICQITTVLLFSTCLNMQIRQKRTMVTRS